MEGKIVQFLESRFHWIFGIMLTIQIMIIVAIVLIGYALLMTAGGLDLIGFDPPGLDELCNILPFVFPLTLITSVSYPRLKGQKWAKWLLIFTVIVNVVLIVQLARFLLFIFL